MSGGSKTQTVSNEPWDAQEDFLMGSGKSIYTPQAQAGLSVSGLYPRAYEASFQPRQFYPGQTYAPMSWQTGQSLGNLWNFGAAPSAVESAAGNQLQRTLAGDYLYGGPGFDAAYQAAANKVIPQVESQWANARRLDSGGAREAMTGALGDVFANLYETERGKQLMAASMAPQMQAMEQQRLAAQQGVGAAQEAWAQKPITEGMARWEFGQNEPYERLNWFNSILQPGNTYSQQSTTGGGSSGLAGALGGGLTGAGIGGSLAGLGASSAGAAAGLGFLASPWTLPIAIGAGLLGGYGASR